MLHCYKCWTKIFLINKELKNSNLPDEIRIGSIIRNNEIITGDYGTLDTDTNSYKVKSNNSKKVKVIITENNE